MTDPDDAFFDAISQKALEEFERGVLKKLRLGGTVGGQTYVEHGVVTVTDFWCLGLMPPHWGTLSFAVDAEGVPPIENASALLEAAIDGLKNDSFEKRADASQTPLVAIEQAGGCCAAMLAMGRNEHGELALLFCHHPAIDPWSGMVLLKEYLRRQRAN